MVALLDKTQMLKDLAVTYGISLSQLGRHKRKHLLVAPLTEVEQIELWLSRAEQLWHLAGANNDVRGLATALQ
ncbi:MAG: hypothetical protein WB660_00590 [Candidatus Sulfotelmatobacter sp.]